MHFGASGTLAAEFIVAHIIVRALLNYSVDGLSHFGKLRGRDLTFKHAELHGRAEAEQSLTQPRASLVVGNVVADYDVHHLCRES